MSEKSIYKIARNIKEEETEVQKRRKKKEKTRSTRELLQSILTIERRNTQNAKNGFPTVGTILETMEFSV